MAEIRPEVNLEKNISNTRPYVEILGDVVKPSHLIYSVLISLSLSFVGYFLGKMIFPGHVAEKMVGSFSLLLGILGNVSALVVSARLFLPKRVLTESYSSLEEQKKVLEELQIDLSEERAYLENDHETRTEMADLNILEVFTPENRGMKK